MSDRRRFLKGLTSPSGRERKIRRSTSLSRQIALHQAGIGQNRKFETIKSHGFERPLPDQGPSFAVRDKPSFTNLKSRHSRIKSYAEYAEFY